MYPHASCTPCTLAAHAGKDRFNKSGRSSRTAGGVGDEGDSSPAILAACYKVNWLPHGYDKPHAGFDYESGVTAGCVFFF